MAIVLSPILPFISEELYTTLTKNESVHLETWPEVSETLLDDALITDMTFVRSFAEVAHRVRKELKLKVRQPLAKVIISRKKTMNYIHEENKELYDAL
jgi:isoleucyl-tRNA synthetase